MRHFIQDWRFVVLELAFPTGQGQKMLRGGLWLTMALAFFAKASALHANLLNTGFLSPDALSQGMGGAHAALGDSLEDYQLNPANLGTLSSLSVDLQGGDLFSTDNLLGGSLLIPPLDGLVGIAFGNQSVWTQSSNNNEEIWNLGFGIPLVDSGDTALGATLKYLDENYGDPGSALGLDFGALQRFHFGKHALNLSFSILDFQTQVQHSSGLEEPLPQIVKAGLAYSYDRLYSLEVDNDWSATGETAGSNQASGGTLHAGVESKLLDRHLALRVGYVLVSGGNAVDAADSGDNDRFDVGLGLRFGIWGLDYAFMPSSGALAATHRLGLNVDLFDASNNFRPLSLERTLSGDHLVYLSWKDPQASPETSYVILMSFRPDTYFARVAQTGGGQCSLELRGLDNGRDYYFKVAILDPSGKGVDSSLSESKGLRPELSPAVLKEALDKARDAESMGHNDLALSYALQAQQAFPNNADAELLVQRLQRLEGKGKP